MKVQLHSSDVSYLSEVREHFSIDLQWLLVINY